MTRLIPNTISAEDSETPQSSKGGAGVLQAMTSLAREQPLLPTSASSTSKAPAGDSKKHHSLEIATTTNPPLTCPTARQNPHHATRIPLIADRDFR